VIGMCDPGRVRPPGDYPLLGGDCTTDSDCVDGVNGRGRRPDAYTHCTYDGCFADADCPVGERCACGAGPQDGNFCLVDYCGDCAAVDCAISWSCRGLQYPAALRCHTADDTCRTEADCDERGQVCTHEPEFSSGPPTLGWRCASPWCISPWSAPAATVGWPSARSPGAAPVMSTATLAASRASSATRRTTAAARTPTVLRVNSARLVRATSPSASRRTPVGIVLRLGALL